MKRFYFGMVLGLGLLGALPLAARADDPSDVHWGQLDGSTTYELTGYHKHVYIDEINGSATVRIHDLQADEIHILRKIDGSPRVFIYNTGATVTIDDKIDGSPVVEITTTGDVSVGTKIDGSSQVRIKNCHNFSVGWKIDGSARVGYHATGSVDIPQVNGGARATAN